ncbi:MAG: biotin/lipoyl-containing protein, partial [Parvibaculum sp.]
MPIEILMPALSPTMEEGTLAKWMVKEGDEVKSGDVIAEIETDKATMEVEAVDEGRIGKLLVAEGTEGVAVNKPIAILLEEGENARDIKAPEKEKTQERLKPADAKATPEAPKPAAKTEAKPTRPEPANGKGGRIFASPLARRIAGQKGIDLSSIQGSGPRGRIVKADIESAKPGTRKPVAPSAASAPASAIDARAFYAEGTYEEIPLDGMRKTIARRLT